jgi:hypothetical protein
MLAKSLQAAAGNAADANYIEDVFSTWLYTGNGSTQTITNGIDLAGEGGLVWFKERSSTGWNTLVDTVRGAGKAVFSNSTEAQDTSSNYISSFTSSGFSLSGSASNTNTSDSNYASWTFRKQPKFFDVVTYTGTGANRTVAHNLGSVPGCIIVKRTDTTGAWQVYHRANTANPETDYLVLNTDAATADSDTRWNDTQPTATVFSLGTEATVNASGGTYVAYLFAHDAGGFGLTGTDNVISCGSYTGNGSADGPEVNLGYEPQWVMVKRASGGTGPWYIVDNMRTWLGTSTGTVRWLQAESSGVEQNNDRMTLLPTGFKIIKNSIFAEWNATGNTYIYIAIRRGPMKVPTDGTKVFSPYAVTVAANASATTNFPIDMVYGLIRGGGDHDIVDRLRGISNTSASSPYLKTDSTSAELSNNIIYNADNQTGYKFGSYYGGASSVFYSFRRAPGFFDEVCYTGTGSNTTFNHNLGVVPELMIMKKRSATDDWAVYAGDNTDFLLLNTTAATADDNTYWNDTSPTSTVFSVGTNADVNTSAATFVAYLFASCPGVSKVGSYTGTAATQTINCGFTAGARFVLIKRTDSTGDWYVWDSARGIVAGDDPYLLLNSTAAEVTNTDYVDTAATGFEITSTAPAAINASGGTFIFLAIA